MVSNMSNLHNKQSKNTYSGMNKKEKEVVFRESKRVPSTTYATFSFYNYPAKFIPQVITYVLDRYAHPGMKVFDPFAGYGTAGLVSKIYGYDYELWDLNPLLETLHDIAILKPKKIDTEEVLKQMANSDERFVPQWSNLHYWFPEEFLQFLYKVWGFYHSCTDTYVKLLLTIPLLNTTRHFSYDDMQRQKLSKSPKSKKRIDSLLSQNWQSQFYQMLKKSIERVQKGMHEYWELSPKKVGSIVKGGVDSFTMELGEEKDILITSPPYLQSQEYIRQAKINLFWLGYSENEVKKLSKLEIPYRNIEPQPIYSETFSKYKEKIEKPHLRKTFDRYFWGTLGTLSRLQDRISSYLFLLVGRTSMQGQPIPIDHILAEHFTSMNWEHKVTLIDKIKSRRMFKYGNNPASNSKDERTKTENLVVLKRKN